MTHSSGIVADPVITTATRRDGQHSANQVRRCHHLGGVESVDQGAGRDGDEQPGQGRGHGDSSDRAADGFTDTASSGSATTRSPSPVSEPAQATTNRGKDAGSWRADSAPRCLLRARCDALASATWWWLPPDAAMVTIFGAVPNSVCLCAYTVPHPAPTAQRERPSDGAPAAIRHPRTARRRRIHGGFTRWNSLSGECTHHWG